VDPDATITGTVGGGAFPVGDALLVHPRTWKSGIPGQAAILISSTPRLCDQIVSGLTTASVVAGDALLHPIAAATATSNTEDAVMPAVLQFDRQPRASFTTRWPPPGDRNRTPRRAPVTILGHAAASGGQRYSVDPTTT
jgi:hypothetical protein